MTLNEPLSRIGDTMKMAFHNVLSDCDADNVDRAVSTAEVEYMEHFAKSLLPAVGKFSKAKTCMYTMTPDEHFLLEQLNGPNENVYLSGGFSGHGFKFAPVIGEIIEGLIAGTARYDISLFNPYRFK